MFRHPSPQINISSNRFIHLAAIAMLGLIAYSNTLWVPFQFDDIPNISANPLIKDFSYFLDPPEADVPGVVRAFQSRYAGYLTLALNYHLHGLDVRGFHLLNILIHLMNGFLVYLLGVLSFRTPRLAQTSLAIGPYRTALVAALFFVLHPVQTQAVTYIVQRFASLATLFYLGSMVYYIKARLQCGKGGWLFYMGSLALAVLAMKTKEIAFTLPLAITLLEFMFFKAGPFKRRTLVLLPILLTMLIIPLTLIDLDRPLTDVMADISERAEMQQTSRGTYLVTEIRVMATYLRLLLLPVNQNLDYDYPLRTSPTQGPVLGALVLIVLLMGLAIYLYRKKEATAKLAAFGIVFFFLALSVESTLVPLHPIYEHRMYLPMAGASIAIATGLVFCLSSLRDTQKRKAVIAAIIMLTLTLPAFTYTRNTIWQSRASLWMDVVTKAPGNARALNNLASEYIDSGQIEEAETLLEKAIRIRPDYAEAYNNLGLLHQEQGLYMQAMEYHRKALSLWPDYPEALNNMGVSMDKTGQHGKALSYYKRAIQVRPFYEAAYENLGVSLGMQGRLKEALNALQTAISLNPASSAAYNNTGNVYFQLGDMREAERYYRKAIELNDAYVDARINLIRAYVAQSRMNKAHAEINVLSRYAPEKAAMLRQSIQGVTEPGPL